MPWGIALNSLEQGFARVEVRLILSSGKSGNRGSRVVKGDAAGEVGVW